MPWPKGVPNPKRPTGKGRPKGSVNKLNKSLREMILGALNDVGGQAYLAQQAKKHPQAFLVLLGRVLPRDPLYAPPQTITLDFGWRPREQQQLVPPYVEMPRVNGAGAEATVTDAEIVADPVADDEES